MATPLEQIQQAIELLGAKRARKGTAEYENYSVAELIQLAETIDASTRTPKRFPGYTVKQSPPGMME
jgi:hypothetical protein